MAARDNKAVKRRQMTKAERATYATVIMPRYERGESIRQLANSTGRSYGLVHSVLVGAGAEFRSRGGAHKRTR